MPLTDIQCRNAKPKADGSPLKLADGGGLFLAVTPAGGKYWRMTYRFDSKQKLLSIGEYPAVPLADARALLSSNKAILKAGKDPALHKAEATTGGPDAFETVAREWLEAQKAAWVPEHWQRVLSRFENDVFPIVGKMRLRDIGAPKILEVLREVEKRGALDVTKRIRQSIGAVFRFGIATGRADTNPAADLVDALKVRPKVKHMAALDADDIGEFLTNLQSYDGERQTRLAIELIMHTMLRTNELRFGTWPEIKGDQWLISGERMKMSRDHKVPLTKQSKRLLAELKEIAGDSEWIVPGASGDKPISQNTMIFALYRLGYHSRLTVHGFRSTASTILNESGLWSPDAIERQLAHVHGDKVRSAYNRSEYWAERVKMMEWWSDYLTERNSNDLSALLI
ncbi:integrase arm-type DNA-binding domain-containing protein [Mesorhizobium sp. M0859]|uniref:tyrosine-type recombinase/integrase n=1 Tax=Mesorhizobium sp. M0859 TaxID=2957014 RepID=UPI0033370DD8